MNNDLSFGSAKLEKDEDGYLDNPWGQVYGYCRVSTKDQNTARQMDALLKYGVREDRVFSEHVSGKDFNRPMYKRMIRILRRGDIVVIKSIDRLGRNYGDIIEQWRVITQDIGCGIHVIDMPLLNTSGDPGDLLSRFITDMMLQVLSFVAENERENTLKRQREGIEAAKKRGITHGGRPRVKIPFEFWEIYVSWKTGAAMAKDLIEYCKEEFGICQRTFYRRIRELDNRYGNIEPSRLKDLILDDYLDGFEYVEERHEIAAGIRNPYVNDPERERERRKERELREELRNEAERKAEEEEMKRIILEKRAEEFRKRFHIPDDAPKSAKRGRKPVTQKPTEVVKTVIID